MVVIAHILSFLPLLLLLTKKMRYILYIRILRTIHYSGMTIGGIVIGLKVSGGNFVNLFPFFIPAIAIAIYAFQGAVLINDYFDFEGDVVVKNKTPLVLGLISPSLSLRGGIFLSIYSILLSFYISHLAGLFVFMAHLINFFYSLPPFRLKKFYPLSTFLLSLGALFMMLTGYSMIASQYIFNFPFKMVILVIVTLTLTFGTKDMKDIEGDRLMGSKNLYTILGEERGRLINAFLVLISYIITPVILGNYFLFVFAIPSGFLTFFFILKKISEKFILLIYILFGLIILSGIIFDFIIL